MNNCISLISLSHHASKFRSVFIIAFNINYFSDFCVINIYLRKLGQHFTSLRVN